MREADSACPVKHRRLKVVANAAEELLRTTRTVVRVKNVEQVMTYESVEFNTVDETVHALPEEVKAQLKPKPSTRPEDT